MARAARVCPAKEAVEIMRGRELHVRIDTKGKALQHISKLAVSVSGDRRRVARGRAHCGLIAADSRPRASYLGAVTVTTVAKTEQPMPICSPAS